ncbi:MAG: hypothetical protein GWP08_15065, partial [Nitrospiraceae bacterium]|nr:hypothetical protein [Nitrospiraceae bacterium]
MKLRLLAHFLRWRATWEKRNTRRAFTIPDNPKFMGPRDAIGLIDDGDVVAVSGMAGNARISLLYWAMKELFQETGHPRGLTVMCTGGQGSRGRVPGTMDEIGIEGLCTRHISAHQETFRPFLRLADAGKIEMQCIPQGVFTQLLDALGRGEDSLVSPIGLGTFLDPRVGSGSSIFDPNAEALIEVEGEQLRYHIPRIDVAMFNAPAV